LQVCASQDRTVAEKAQKILQTYFSYNECDMSWKEQSQEDGVKYWTKTDEGSKELQKTFIMPLRLIRGDEGAASSAVASQPTASCDCDTVLPRDPLSPGLDGHIDPGAASTCCSSPSTTGDDGDDAASFQSPDTKRDQGRGMERRK
jgi:hypothetical protein